MAGKKSKHDAEHHADERWLITYADVLTLLFVLFMVLFSMSVVNTSKFEKLRDSLAGSFSAGIFDGGKAAMDQGATQSSAAPVNQQASTIRPNFTPNFGVNLTNSTPQAALENAQLEKAKKAIDREAARAGVSDQVKTTIDERGLTIRLRTDPMLFASGSAQMGQGAETIVVPVSRALVKLPNRVVVDGHTDTDPIHTTQYPNNFFLGGARACTVMGALVAHGVTQAQECNSFGATRPVVDNETVEHKAQNRRVEILVVRNNPVGTATP